MTSARNALPLVAVVDLLICLVIVFVLAVNPRATHGKPAIPDTAAYVVTIEWSAKSNDDVDMYVRGPDGQIVYFVQPTVGTMHLEHDDQGQATTETVVTPDGQRYATHWNGERLRIQRVVPGEYAVNVQMYEKRDRGPQDVTVKLWKVRGARLIQEKHMTFYSSGQEQAAFQFRVDAAGRVMGIEHNTTVRLVGVY